VTEMFDSVEQHVGDHPVHLGKLRFASFVVSGVRRDVYSARRGR
jgi:hypothetical protein